jgi:hypothetical protein
LKHNFHSLSRAKAENNFFLLFSKTNDKKRKCLDEAKAARDWEREAPSAIARWDE